MSHHKKHGWYSHIPTPVGSKVMPMLVSNATNTSRSVTRKCWHWENLVYATHTSGFFFL